MVTLDEFRESYINEDINAADYAERQKQKEEYERYCDIASGILII